MPNTLKPVEIEKQKLEARQRAAQAAAKAAAQGARTTAGALTKVDEPKKTLTSKQIKETPPQTPKDTETKHNGSVGRSGYTITDGSPRKIGVKLPAGMKPVKIEFHTASGGAYWTNRDNKNQRSTTVYLGNASGSVTEKIETITLAAGKSRTTHVIATLDGESLAGADLTLIHGNDSNYMVGLRNACTITVWAEKAGGSAAEKSDGEVVSAEIYKKLLPTVDQNKKIVDMARRAAWQVKVQGVDISDEIKKDLISIEITDNEEDAADDLQIKLADREAVWLQEWLNDTIQAGVKTKGLSFAVWIGKNDHTGKVVQQKAGTFTLDSIKHSGPPSAVTIKCTSLDFAGGIRTEKRDKAWERYNLKGIAQEIAKKGGLQLSYCCNINPTYSRRQQDQETDIAFLVRVCHDEGVSVKISDGHMILFQREIFENMEAIDKIVFGDGSYTKWDLGTSTGDVTFDKCIVTYTDPATGKSITGSYQTDEYAEEEEKDDPKHQILKVQNVKVTSIAEANSLAESRLKLRNQFERVVTLTFPGNPAVIAGLPIELVGFGYWSGKYIISQAKHSIQSSGYSTKAKLRYIDPNETAAEGDTVSGTGPGTGKEGEHRYQGKCPYAQVVCKSNGDIVGLDENGKVIKKLGHVQIPPSDKTIGSTGSTSGGLIR